MTLEHQCGVVDDIFVVLPDGDTSGMFRTAKQDFYRIARFLKNRGAIGLGLWTLAWLDNAVEDAEGRVTFNGHPAAADAYRREANRFHVAWDIPQAG
jgi:hypothetical protein